MEQILWETMDLQRFRSPISNCQNHGSGLEGFKVKVSPTPIKSTQKEFRSCVAFQHNSVLKTTDLMPYLENAIPNQTQFQFTSFYYMQADSMAFRGLASPLIGQQVKVQLPSSRPYL